MKLSLPGNKVGVLGLSLTILNLIIHRVLLIKYRLKESQGAQVQKWDLCNHFRAMQQDQNLMQPGELRKGVKKPYNPEEIKKQRITRRMRKIISKQELCLLGREKEKCAICLADIERNSASLPCGHTFCLGCIANWWITNSTCPFCRQHFELVYDERGRKLGRRDLDHSGLIQREQTLKCEACWADIGQESMRICLECRSVYIHSRCQTKEEAKLRAWRCEECLQEQEEKLENYIEQCHKRTSAPYYSWIDIDQLNSRHSQRIRSNLRTKIEQSHRP